MEGGGIVEITAKIRRYYFVGDHASMYAIASYEPNKMQSMQQLIRQPEYKLWKRHKKQ